MKGFWDLPNHKDVWLPYCRHSLQSKHFQGVLVLLFLASYRENLPHCFSVWSLPCCQSFILIRECSLVATCLLCEKCPSSVAFLYDVQASSEISGLFKETKNQVYCKNKSMTCQQVEVKSVKTISQASQTFTHAPPTIKSLHHYLICWTWNVFAWKKAFAFELHQELRNATRPGANRSKCGHYKTLDAAKGWCQPFYSPLVCKPQVNVYCWMCRGKGRVIDWSQNPKAEAATCFIKRHLLDKRRNSNF